MTATHDFNLDSTKSESAIDEAVSIELETTVQQNEVSSSELADPSPLDLATLSLIEEVFKIVNSERGRVGLSPLRLHSQLTAAAQAHSDDMARHNFLSHIGSDGSSPFDRITQYGYNFRWAGENIASGYSSPQDVMQGWMNSSGHRANILNRNFRDIGIGYARGNQPYWTQTFGG
ncbi:CAP domain-containing protein [Pleurocapsa sp. PCC 7319]|uniref:CAP domain-containing protein n=1 Tax=Pleurocapsa sp. PCC 7319 TaxID=118161 RepID=UPI00034818BD|nr:CAP domain-containing protein [Pleurocapsa sp. PCC 7319]